MAGNSNSGRHRLPIGEHLDAGTYRADRHGPLPDAAEGEPARPKGMTGDARKHWDRIVPDLVKRGMAKAIDAAALEQLCHLWALSVATLKLLRKFPSESKTAGVYRGYVREYNAIAKRFGLAFGDRQKLKVVAKPAEGPRGVASRKRA